MTTDIDISGADLQSVSGQTTSGNLPSVWLVMGYRAGESTQILALAQALNWPYEIKRLAYRSCDFIPGLMRGTTLVGIDREKSSPLQAPWPDFVISAGMRNEPVCRWIKKQSAGRTRLIHIGRTWANMDHFDLIITTPQYRLPERHNVLQNSTTIHGITETLLNEATATWAPRLAHLSRPYIAVIIGGNSGPYTFGRRAASRLARAASAMAKSCGATLLITTSARTSGAASEVLEATIDCPMHLFRWTPGAGDNPYYAFLALADAIIVTSDSISMLTEACATRKPVYIFDLDAENTPPTTAHTQFDKAGGKNDIRIAALLYQLLMHFGPQRLTRDLGLVHQRLIRARRAVWLGEHFPEEAPEPLDDVQKAVSRIRLLADKSAGSL